MPVANAHIRPAGRGDVDAISALIQRTIRISNARDDDAASIEQTIAMFSKDGVLRRLQLRDVFVALEGERVLGTGAFSDGKIHSLFVEPEFQRLGIGAQLVRHIEAHALAKGLSRLSLSSSITARDFYQRIGYSVDRFEARAIGSTYLMSKRLSGAADPPP